MNRSSIGGAAGETERKRPLRELIPERARARILERATGSDRFAFCMTSTSAVPAGATRCYAAFSEAAAENAASRVLIGYHFRSATRAGMRLGRQIGSFAFLHALRPLERRAGKR